MEQRDSRLSAMRLSPDTGGMSDPYSLLHVGADLIVIVASLVIAALLVYYLRRRADLWFGWVLVALGGCALFSGLGRVLQAQPTWVGAPWLSAAADVAAAGAAMLAAVLLLRALPRALALPNTAALDDVHAKLQAEMLERHRAETDLKALHDALEQTRRRKAHWRRARIGTGP